MLTANTLLRKLKYRKERTCLTKEGKLEQV